MNYSQLTNPVVQAVFRAWNNQNREQFIGFVSPSATFIHNGERGDIMAFADQFFFGQIKTTFTGVYHTENNGLTVYADMESALAGKVQVLMHFEITDGKISHLNAGRP